jgi:maleylpyruvate isomerase
MTVDVPARITALERSMQALDHTLEHIDDEQARGRSLLPGWSRGHVLSHLARNADGLLNLVRWARTGEETPMYVSREQRDADIEAGAGRPAADLVEDVRSTQARLMDEMKALDEEQWQRKVRWGRDDHQGYATAIPAMRRVEVEIHHVDLDLEYTLAHLPEEFVEDLLVRTARDYSQREGTPGFVLVGSDDEGRWQVGDGGQEISVPPPALLGWLLGRTDGVGLHAEGRLPTLEAWK